MQPSYALYWRTLSAVARFGGAKAEREASTEIAKSADIQYIMRVGFFTHRNTHQSKIQIDCKSYMIKIDI